VSDEEKRNSRQNAKLLLNSYALMLTWLFVVTISLASFIAVTAFLSWDKGESPPFLPYVALSGAMGGFISALSRLYGLKDLPALLVQENIRLVRNLHVAMYALIPPVVGMVGAVVLYISMAGDLLDGALFPNFGCPQGPDKCPSGMYGLMEYGPQKVQDYAKALVWAFICGFSERFFPSVMEALSKKATQDGEI